MLSLRDHLNVINVLSALNVSEPSGSHLQQSFHTSAIGQSCLAFDDFAVFEDDQGWQR